MTYRQDTDSDWNKLLGLALILEIGFLLLLLIEPVLK